MNTLLACLNENQAKLSEIELSLKSFLSTTEPQWQNDGELSLRLRRSLRPYAGREYQSLDVCAMSSSLRLHPLGTAFKLIKMIHALNPYEVTYLDIAPEHILYEILRGSRWQVDGVNRGLFKFKLL